MAKTARVMYDGALAALLSETDEGYVLKYDEQYLSNPSNKPISLTLPLREEIYLSKVLFPFFDGLIPEGWLLDIAVTHWKVKRNDRFELLLTTCRDTIGAVTVEPE
ncbi:HipA N-terminal domain-containing protein [Sediminibacterium sp.]|jgi:serine/threonine-protein kinase HipA|uniref:HipA N-terminal domain-containing protein n=1 Tax=Sediminibacterium sp. TaxID=1917865 RepID=UPI0025CC0B3D|nr:HipA N-terminal domain-containing protein [Sediminibacterium sp.]MBT9483883.1 HipA N-terminal domain-containing protein [Sediminibacterium sp.]MDO8995518.1 HipA N-terminal domain-containing protein [Sediminibacterium sp.]MDO9157117.1 HipA N-terminal domain-containing protein [Sediminibacterium sp.]MDP1972954.1 HipA N-terminal domain-containing protein [Sediminibacterium sp.]MDP2421503.1 HipA N-terminal domain-containing protein [Sediminibacterium sp.]